MDKFDEAIKLVEEKFGNNRDNLISIATIALELNGDGKPCPVVRDVDAYYENGTFYVSTWGTSNKMLQIDQNPEVSFSVAGEWFNGSAIGENLGWVLKPENSQIREKLRKAFCWYDDVNNEQDENCVILAIHIKKAILNINHWEKLYFMDFENKTCN